VLLNLVGNAIKFTADGEVEVRVENQNQKSEVRSQRSVGENQRSEVRGPKTEGDEASSPTSLTSDLCPLTSDLRFTVRDTGIGIPLDKQEQIFRAFEQEDTSTTRRYGGTGLGLTIASRLVSLMGGAISVDSAPGHGSTFAFTARFGRQPDLSEPLTVAPPVSLQNLPVLVVDDNSTNRHILQEWLRAWQMKPETVGDGIAAMDALWHGIARGSPYPLVLLDARMPDTEGLALAAKMRERAELAGTRIILMTSGERPGDLARLRDLRVSAHVLKPLHQQELLETIYQVMSRAPAAGGGLPAHVRPAPAVAGPRLHLLVAEDNDFNARLLEQLLQRRGQDVRLASDGGAALRLAETGGFDVLLLDLHMPELDGFQVAEAIRRREQTTGGRLPIIALTARSRKEDRERCLAAGMDGFLAKPIQANELWAAINQVVSAKSPAKVSSPSLINARVLLAACGNDTGILEKICQRFRAHLPDHLQVIADALRDGDAPRLREAAHKLCGMISTFSTEAGGVASDLEDQAARGELEGASAMVEQLRALGQELMRATEGLSLERLREQAASGA
jgi:two-component system, sensor histidine kinase and response regulator